MKELETERLRLRPFQPEDRAAIHRLVYGDPLVAPGWTGRTWTLEEITESFAHKLAQRRNRLDFQAIVHKTSGELMGLIGFQLHEEGELEEYLIFEHEANRRPYDPAYSEAASALSIPARCVPSERV